MLPSILCSTFVIATIWFFLSLFWLPICTRGHGMAYIIGNSHVIHFTVSNKSARNISKCIDYLSIFWNDVSILTDRRRTKQTSNKNHSSSTTVAPFPEWTKRQKVSCFSFSKWKLLDSAWHNGLMVWRYWIEEFGASLSVPNFDTVKKKRRSSLNGRSVEIYINITY